MIGGRPTETDTVAACVQRVRHAPGGRTREELDALRALTRALHGDPAPVWRAVDRYGGVVRAWRAVGGTPPASTPARAPALRAGPGDGALPFWDPRYPARLWRLPDPPPLLFARGDLTLLARPALAIVGTRRCSEHGRAAARAIALAVGGRGIVVVSGHAQGIDAAAHDAAIATGTVAVLGCGLDIPYPRVLGGLRARIERRGLVLSEFPAGTAPLPRHFPRRNRLIAALAHGVVVVEAPHRSGAQNTATHALDLGVDVGAVPGPIDRANCAGSNRLLREGAAVICEPVHALDLLEVPAPGVGPASARSPAAGAGPNRSDAGLREGGTASRQGGPASREGGTPDPGPHAGAGVSERIAAMLAGLGDRPFTADELAERLQIDVGVASAALLELELGGGAERGPGGRYSAPHRR